MSFSSPLASDSAETLEAPSPKQKSVASEAAVQIDKKIIKSGSLTLKVSSVDKAAADITSIAQGNGGDAFSTNFYQRSDNVKSGTITVKVPVAKFENTFSEIKKVASLVERESTSGQDVTEQYTDLQSQLKNKQAEEQAFAKILERSGSIDDVLKVTRELARVRGEIEVLQGRIKFMDSQTDMSTITASVSEDTQITITDKWRPLQIIKDSVSSLMRSLQKYVNFVIVLIIQVIPLLILYFILLWFIYIIGRKIYRKFRKKKDVNAPQPPAA